MVGRGAVRALAAVAVALGTVTACGGGAGPTGEVSVVVPGRPGEDARTMSPDEVAERFAPAPVSPADVAFVERMIPHHRQALDMAALAPDRAADPGVRAVADRIAAAQGPEILVLQAWLDGHEDAAGPGHGGHGAGHGGDHAGMPGMATTEQLAALAAASGPAFDALFVHLMVAHHEGAIAMSAEVLAAGTDVTVAELAQDVSATQGAEIERMRELLP